MFKLDPATKTLTTLHAFDFNGTGGASPRAGLVFDANGELYGTTFEGGAHVGGTVFKLDPANKVLTTLHAFTGGTDGDFPTAGLVFDTKGALYGTTSDLGGAGTVFELVP